MCQHIPKKLLSVILCFTMIITSVIVFCSSNYITTQTNAAVSGDYAPQLMNIALYDDSKNLTVLSADDKTSASLANENGTLNEQWRIDYCGADSNGNYYKIVNAASGRLLTPYEYSLSAETETVIYGNENNASQYWYIIPVSKDSYGNDLHYKIVNYSDPSMALTAGSSSTSIISYSGANNQKWLLNCAGLDGFAGYSKDNSGNVKASVTGGLLGPTIEVSTFDELKNACTSDITETIVITKDISKIPTNGYLTSGNGRLYWRENTIYIHPNKTVIGSYDAHSTYNVYFATYDREEYGKGSNFIIKNLTVSHDTELNCDNIYDFPYGINIWMDHITFEGHEKLETASTGLDDWDKFLCIYQDANFATVSNCSFGHHHYGCLYGYPADSEENYQTYNGKPYITIVNNYYKDCLTRAPGLLRYGFYHSFNNYVYNVSLGYTLYTASTLYDECNYYDGGGNSGKIVNDAPGQGGGDDTSAVHLSSYAMSGSVLVNSKYSLKPTYAKLTSWKPASNYTYSAKSAENSKNYCTSYSGAQSSSSKINYNSYANAGVPSANYMVGPDDEWGVSAAVIPTNTYYMIKNANSGLYLDVAGGSASNGANVQQWGASGASVQNTWRFVYAEEGYYYIQSMVGDKTFVMDVTGGKSDNGTNIEIYSYKGNDNQKFMLTANSDGTYKIAPKIGSGKTFVEIANASVSSGDNCQIYEKTNSKCQDWILEEVSFSGEKMDTSVNYMFKNANSGLYMEVKDASDTDGANVQQWEANGSGENKSAEWNSWQLKTATDDLYYIVSNLPGRKYITINNDNAELSPRNSSSNIQMMRFVKNPDGTYCIVTRNSFNKSSGRYTKSLEVANASSSAGANIQQWTINGESCQNWEIKTFTTTTTTTTTTTAATTTTTTTTTSASATSAANTTTTSATTEPAETIVWGDANSDGTLLISDAVAILAYSSNPSKVNIKNTDICDVYNHGDGISAEDSLSVQKRLVNVISELPESYLILS